MPKKPLPQFVAPMQASSVKKPFDSPDWIFETKLDGYRAIAVIDTTGKARIWSRNRLPLEPKFGYSITPMAFDPEPPTVTLKPVAVNPSVGPQRRALVMARNPIVSVAVPPPMARNPSVEIVLRSASLVTPVAGIQAGGCLEKRGVDLFRLAKEKGLEGIIAKRKTSIYQPGKRSTDWLKIKARPQQEFVVGGLTEGKGSRKHFGAAIIGRVPRREAPLLLALREWLYRKGIERSGRSLEAILHR